MKLDSDFTKVSAQMWTISSMTFKKEWIFSFFFQIFGSKSGQVFQELDQIKNFQSLTTNILCGLLAMSYSSQFLKKKTLNIISDQNLDIQSMFYGKFLILH